MAFINLKAFVLLITTVVHFLSGVHSFSSGGITLDLIHRDSLKNDTNNNRFANLRSAFRRSFARQRALSNSLPSSSSLSPDPNNFNATLFYYGSGDYIMKFKIGTPPVEILAMADTGSDLTWTQCTPCEHCFDQPDPLFDPTQSSSYSQVSCSASGGKCSSCDDKGFCPYQVAYGDGSYSRGDLASETFTFESDNGDQSLSIPKVFFGCGRNNSGDFGAAASGIVGLGGGDLSIIRQLDANIDGRFSYCLTSRDDFAASSKISFGNNAVVTGPNVVSTPLSTRKDAATFYYVALEGISVGNETFMLREAASFDHSINGGTVKRHHGNSEVSVFIDSGTTLTYVPRDLYNSVESAAAAYITGTRVSDPQGIFGLCYDTSSGGIATPKVVVHFRGADVAAPDDGIFVEVEVGIRCLSLGVPKDGRYIFGNLLQMNYHVGFDLKEMTVSFLPTDCSQLQ